MKLYADFLFQSSNGNLPFKIFHTRFVKRVFNYFFLHAIALLSFMDTSAQVLVAGWDFQTTTSGGTAILTAPNSPTVINANFGNGIIYLNGTNGSSPWITATTGNQLTAFGGSTVNAGIEFSTNIASPASLALVNSTANGKSIVFSFSMSGYINLTVSYATQKTSTGFSTQQWDYSTDAINWVSAQTITGMPSTFGLQTLNNITALNYLPNAYLRLTFTGASSAGGNNRLDNIRLNATSSNPTPVVMSGSASGTVGVPFSYFINATNSPSSYTAVGLPAGLSLDNLSGQISGIPTSFFPTTSMTITATNNGGTGSALLNLNITQGTQSISFPSIAPKTYGDPSFILNASGGASGNPVTFVSSDTSVATVTGSTVNVLGAGTANITASQAGNTDYLPAANVVQTLTVNQANQVINFNPISPKLITDSPFVLSASGGASGNPITFVSSNPSVATVSGNMVTITGYGSSTITASQVGNNNFLPASDVSENLEVNQVPQTIVFNSLPSKLVSDPPFTLIATGGASGNPITFTSSNTSVATVNGNTVTLIGSGITIITASQAGNTIYSAATNVSQSLIVNSNALTAKYTFGTAVAPTANPTSGVPITNLTLSAISQGNNANINQTSITLTTVSSSNNAGSSGEMNAGITARNRNFQLDSSAYFEFSLSPAPGNMVTLYSISFGSRSTSTGPTTLDIRSSLDNYGSSMAAVNVAANSIWTLINPSFVSLSANSTITIRIYGYVTGGSGSINTGSSPNNWRIDDLQLMLSVINSFPCNLSASVLATPITCNGGSSTLTVTANNASGNVNYKLNTTAYQASNVFNNIPANIYTVTVSDAYLCSASTVITVTEPNALIVTATNATGCDGVPLTLYGYPLGGTFSVSNPYTGPSTSFVYSYTDSAGCTSVSQAANITVNNCAVLNLKLYLQSYFIGSGMMAPVLYNQNVSLSQNIVDDVLVELRDPNNFSLVASSNVTLNINGTTQVSFPSISGYFYIVIKHRNSIQTWSSSPVLLGSTPITYDFSTAASKAFGNNLKEVEPGVWAIYSGDLQQDENIDLLDLPELEADVENFVFGYFATDLNGDGNVDLLDGPILEDNIANFIYSNHPVFIVFPETMEAGTKTVYALADIILSTGSWNFDDALIGTSASDRKYGAKSARLQNTGKITMNFDVFIDSSLITVSHAKYGSDANSTWALFISTNNGTSWSQQGSTVSTNSTTLQSATFVVNVTGNVRFQIRKLSGGKLNIDDFNMSANTVIIIANDNDHIAMGNPSDALTDLSFPDNYLLIKPQFDLAYDNSRGTAAWVAWHLDLGDVGTTPRCDCFATDMQIPSSFFRASSSNYTGSGFDRGHMVPSSHRNNNITNNAVTFLMSNIMPQSPNLNQLTWNNLESYCNTLINNGYELYTYSGGYGSGGTGSNGGITYTLASGNITVPSHYWKIIVVLPVGNNDVTRVSNSTRIIAVDMPNTQTVSTNSWGYYRTSIDAIESATGFDFLKNISTTLQNTLESVIDAGPTN